MRPKIAVALLLACSPVLAQAQPPAREENPLVLAKINNSLEGFALSPDGASVVLWGVDWGDPNQPDRKRVGQVQVWDIATRTQKASMIGHIDALQNAVWSGDGTRLASQSQDGMVALWDAQSGKLLHTLAPAGPRPNFGPEASREEAWRSVIAMTQRSSLLGFSQDGAQVLAVAASVDVPAKPPAKGTKRIDFQSLVQPLLRVWDARSGREIRSAPFGKRGGRISQQALLPGSTRFVDVVQDNSRGEFHGASVETRDAASGALLFSWTIPKAFGYPLHFSDDGSRLLCASWDGNKFDKSRAQVFDSASGQAIQVLVDEQADMVRARFSRDNKRLIADVPGGSVALFDIASGHKEQTLATGHYNQIAGAALTPDNKYLLSSDEAGSELQRWDLSAPASNPISPRAVIEASNLRVISLAPDGSIWAGWGGADWGRDLRTGKSLELRHTSVGGKILEEISIPEKALADQVTFSPDFSLAAASLSTQPQPAYMQGAGVGVWSIRDKKLLWRLPGNEYLMDKLAFSPDAKILVTASNENIIQEWDMATGQATRKLFKPQSEVQSLAFSPDGKLLAMGTEGGTIALLAMPSGDKVGELGNDPSVQGLAWSADGKRVACGGTVRVGGNIVGVSASVWDVESQNVVAEFSIPDRVFTGLALSPDNKSFALSHIKSYERSEDGRIDILDIATRKLRITLRDRTGAAHPAFALDSRSLFSIDGSWIKAWDLESVPGSAR